MGEASGTLNYGQLTECGVDPLTLHREEQAVRA